MKSIISYLQKRKAGSAHENGNRDTSDPDRGMKQIRLFVVFGGGKEGTGKILLFEWERKNFLWHMNCAYSIGYM